MGKKKKALKYGRARSVILLRVTILVSAVVIVSGILTFFLIRDSQQHIAEKCNDCLLQTVAENVSNSYSYIAQLLMPGYVAQTDYYGVEQLATAALKGEVIGIQQTLNHDMGEMLNAGFLGLDRFMVIMPPSAMTSKPFVWACDDPSLVYNWEVPGYLATAMEDGSPYLWMEGGVPELGLEDGYLITQGKVENPFVPGLIVSYFAFKPMQKEMDAARAFFNSEKGSANALLGLVIAGFIAVILAIVFLLINHLIKKRVTGPLDRLSAAAEEVMQGNLDVEIEVREDEEFADLAYAFRKMVHSFRGLIARSVGEAEEDAKNSQSEPPLIHHHRRSSILWQITFILVMVLLVYGVAAYFILRHSQDRLIDHGTERIIQTEADNFLSSLDYAIEIKVPAYTKAFKLSDIGAVLNDLAAGRLSELQQEVDANMRQMVAAGFHDLEKVMLVVPSSTLNPETIVWASSDESLIYDWQCPQRFVEAMQDGTPYMLLPEGIPELGLAGEYLVTFTQVENPLIPGMPFVYMAIKPMSLELAAIEDFCDQERARANLYLASILEVSIIIVILIAFLFLSHLLKEQIVQPAQELSDAAGMVMDGDLDVTVSVREGEELEGLKCAFNEMVKSFRDMLTRSVGKDDGSAKGS